jgi:hypothetical protein
MRLCTLLGLFVLGIGLAPAVKAGQPEEDEATLKESRVPADTPGLLLFFRKRVLPENDHQRVRELLQKLGAESFQEREKATAALIALGPGIAPLLREATSSNDPEVASRSKDCLAIAEKTSTAPLLCAAVRLLGHRKPVETAKTLIDFAPFAGHEEVRETLRETLPKVALRDGKLDPALRAALEDKLAARRALGVETLIQLKQLTGKEARKFLADESAFVRLRTALALAQTADREAIPVLIDVLPAVNLLYAWQAEDLLCRLAGDKSPQVSLTEDEATRKNARDAWQRWWKEQGAKVDLAKLKDKPPFLGLTTVVYQDFRGQGILMELGRDGKERWKVSGLLYPVDLQILGRDRFLVAEINGAKVTERNRKGEILWQKQINLPCACQRLKTGNTMIATRNGVFEYDAKGKQVFTYTRGRLDIMGARKHSNGEYLLLTRTQLIRINAKGQQTGAFNIGNIYTWSSFQVLPNGNVLLPISARNEVAEFTLAGKKVWSGSVPYPTSVQRLPNGNTVATSMGQRRVIELDRTGKQVAQTPVNGTPLAVLRR